MQKKKKKKALTWAWQRFIADTPSEFLDWKSDISLFAFELFGLGRGKWVSLKHPGEAEDGWRGTRVYVFLCDGGVELGRRGGERDERRVGKSGSGGCCLSTHARRINS